MVSPILTSGKGATRTGSDTPSARYFGLEAAPYSHEAMGFADHLVSRAWVERKTANQPGKPFKRAIGAVVADIIATGKVDRDRWGYRPLDPKTFTELAIGYASFKAVLDTFKVLGLVEIDPTSGNFYGNATRMRGTAALFNLAVSFGVRPEDYADHFKRPPKPAVIKDPLKLRGPSKLAGSRKIPGEIILIDYTDPAVSALAKRVHDINAFMAKQVIEPDCHWAFQRVFNEGKKAGYTWDKGGRLMSMGDSYQQMPQVERKAITINGERTVELDIRASHLTIMRTKLGIRFNPADDPYAGCGVPRHVAKSWVTMTLGYGKLHQRWSGDAKADHIKRGGTNLTKEHPIKDVRDRMLKHLPFLMDGEKVAMHWADLQFLESQAVVATVSYLASQGIPALPVHDSIIVPEDHQVRATAVLQKAFEGVTGMACHIEAK